MNAASDRRIRILYFATYRSSRYVRQEVIRHSLAKLPDVTLTQRVYNGRSAFRYVRGIVGFLRAHPGQHDLVIVGFRGQELMPLLRLFTRTPIMFDAFVSLYDTWCDDRKAFSPRSLRGRFVRWYDGLCCRIADRIMLDTDAHIEYFVRTFGVPREKFTRVFVGADWSLYFPREDAPHDGSTVLFYGTYHPVHGADVIIEAARILASRTDIMFRMVGDGPERTRVEERSKRHGMRNVTFEGNVPQERLADMIAQADVCLGGHFSSTGKAQRVIAGKTFQFLAMRRATVVSDTPGNRELLTDRRDCLMVPLNDPERLAHSIALLCDDASLRGRIAAEGCRTFERSMKRIETDLATVVRTYGA